MINIERKISNGVKINILGVLINKISTEEVLDKIKNWLNFKKQHYIVTPNPEIIVASQKEEEFKNILNQADIAIPDGTGLVFASLFSLNCLHRIHGSDLTYQILEIAKEKKSKIYFFIWSGGLSNPEEVKIAIKNKYQYLEIEGQGIERGQKNIDLRQAQNFQPDILLVGLGAPWQEKFIAKYLSQIPSVKIAMGIGGSFDFMTGKTKRAPLILRKLGIEWLWRLIKQPQRWKRIFNAFIKFPFLFFKSKIK